MSHFNVSAYLHTGRLSATRIISHPFLENNLSSVGASRDADKENVLG